MGVNTYSYDTLADHFVDVIGRGCRLLSMYFDIRNLREEDWAFLASLLSWARRNEEIFRHTTLVGGDPESWEAYGYAHFHGDRGILVLRDPCIEARTLELRLDGSVGWHRKESASDGSGARSFGAHVVYPRLFAYAAYFHYGDTIAVDLRAYETLVLQIDPRGEAGFPVAGIPFEIKEQKGSGMTYRVYGRAGETVPVSLDGGRRSLSISFPGAHESSCVTAIRGAEISPAGDGWRWSAVCSVSIPPGATASLHLLCLPERWVTRAPVCAVRISGNPVTLRVNDMREILPRDFLVEFSYRPWIWYAAELTTGARDVTVTLDFPPKG